MKNLTILFFGRIVFEDTGLSLKDSSAESHTDCRGLAHEGPEESKDFNSNWARGHPCDVKNLAAFCIPMP